MGLGEMGQNRVTYVSRNNVSPLKCLFLIKMGIQCGVAGMDAPHF